MTSGQLPFPTHPPDIDCFLNGSTWHLGTFGTNNCSVTSNMVDFLNLTGSDYKPYFAAYCLNPPADDDCPFGFCPNPDITGPLVRVANYITGFCLSILVLYSPKRIEAAFWSQILLTYSLLFSCGISLIRGELTQFHSVALITIVSSPVNVYFASCSIRAFWGTHRLDAVLGKKQYIQRALVVFSSLIWIAIFVYTYLPKRCTKFAQASCQWYSSMGFFSLGLFFMYHLPWGVIFLFQHPDTKGVTLRLPVAMLFYVLPHLSWFAKMWMAAGRIEPFLRLFFLVLAPTVSWIVAIEIGIMFQDENTFSLTFGQVLAIFASVPPIVQVARLVPHPLHWLKGLKKELTDHGVELPRTNLDPSGRTQGPAPGNNNVQD